MARPRGDGGGKSPAPKKFVVPKSGVSPQAARRRQKQQQAPRMGRPDPALKYVTPLPKDSTPRVARRKRQKQQQATVVTPYDVWKKLESKQGQKLYAAGMMVKETSPSSYVVFDQKATAKLKRDAERKLRKDPALSQVKPYTNQDREKLKPRSPAAVKTLGPNPLVRQKGAPADYVTKTVFPKVVKGSKKNRKIIPAKKMKVPNPKVGGPLNPLAATIGNTRSRKRNATFVHHAQGTRQRAVRKAFNQAQENPYVQAPKPVAPPKRQHFVPTKVERKQASRKQAEIDRAVRNLEVRGGHTHGLRSRDKAIEVLKNAGIVPHEGPKDKTKLDLKRERAAVKQAAQEKAYQKGVDAVNRRTGDSFPAAFKSLEEIAKFVAPFVRGEIKLGMLLQNPAPLVEDVVRQTKDPKTKKALERVGRDLSNGKINLGNLKTAGISLVPKDERVVGKVGVVLGKTANEVGKEIKRDPVKNLGRTAVDLAMMAKSIPAGVQAIATHPVRSLEFMRDDYKRRYGDVYTTGNVNKMKKRLAKEGVTSELLDLITVATLAGGSGGKVVQKVAETGMIGKGAKSVAMVRPRRAIGGGVEIDQKVSRNFFVNASRRGVDRARQRSRNRAYNKNEQTKLRDRRVHEDTGQQVPYNQRPTISLRHRQAIDQTGNVLSGRTRLFGRKIKAESATRIDVTPTLQRQLKEHFSVASPTTKEGKSLKATIDALPDGAKKSQRLDLSVKEVKNFDDALQQIRKNASTDRVDVLWNGARHTKIRMKLAQFLEGSKKGDTSWKEISGGGEVADAVRAKLRNYSSSGSPFRASLTADEAVVLERVLNRVGPTTSGRQLSAFKNAASDLNVGIKQVARDSHIQRGADVAEKQVGRTASVRATIEGGFGAETVPTISGGKYLFGSDKMLRKAVADMSARAFVGLKVEQQQFMRDAAKRLNGLNTEEKNALFYAMNHGITTPDVARKWLKRRRKQIVSNRKEFRDKNGGLDGYYDELPTLDHVLENVDRAFTPKMVETARHFRRVAKRQGKADPSLTKYQMRERELGPQARMLGIKREDYSPGELTRGEGESVAEFTARKQRAVFEAHRDYVKAVLDARKKEGLATPGFWRGEIRPRDEFSVYTIGGAKAVKEDSKTTYALVDRGRANMDPEVFARGVMSNIKRRHNWGKVADVYDKVTVSGYKNMTLEQLRRAVEKGNINFDEIAFWNPRKFRENTNVIGVALDEARYDAEQLDKSPIAKGYKGMRDQVKRDETILDPDRNSMNITQLEMDDKKFSVHTAIKGEGVDQMNDSVLTFDSAQSFGRFVDEVSKNESYVNSGWSVVSRGAHDEIMASTKPSSMPARVWDIGKGKVSRILLFNPVWLQFQIGSNAMLTGLAGVGPVSILSSLKWWHKLSEAEKQAVSPYIGVHRYYDEQTHLGSQTPAKGATGNLINSWQALKNTTVWRRGLKKLNPLDAVFKADNAQNNFWRRAVFYKEANRAAYREMGSNMGHAIRYQAQITDLMKLKPQDSLNELLKNPKFIEQHAEKVNDFLGNWLSYTNLERRFLGRSVMFYGFVRFSTKLTFYTMPVKHPLMTEILLKLGELQKDELRRLFGSDVPFWEIGNYYDKKGEGYSSWQTSRLNPFFNLYTLFIGDSTPDEARLPDPNVALSMLPPFVVALVDQFAKQQVEFGNKPWTIDRASADVSGQREDQRITYKDRAQILAEQIFTLSPWYRAAEKYGIGPFEPLRGKQSSDTSLFKQQAIRYKQADSVKRNKVRIRRQNEDALGDTLQSIISPVVSSGGLKTIESSREYAKYQASKGKKKKKKKKVKPSFGGGSSYKTDKSNKSSGPAF